MSGVEIKVGGAIYGGWKSCRIERGIEQIAGVFELGVTERWPGQDTPRPIKRGEACQVLIGDDPVVTGFVDDVTPEFSKESHDISIAGRDATGDLVDCSAMHKSGQWVNATLDKIARDLCAPFKTIKVLVETEIGAAFPTYSINEGETAFECIERACRMRAVLPVSDGLGNLVLTRAKSGTAVAALVEGKNILHGRGEFSFKERFSQYILKGQDRGNDETTAETWTHVKAESTDSGITRYRPLIVLAEEHGVNATYRERAEWERNVRRGRSARATITVQGWRNVSGALWQPNTLVRLTSPTLGADTDLLIVSLAYVLDDGGSRTELHLAGREAFDLLAGVKGTRLDKALKGKDGAAQHAPGEKKQKDSELGSGF